MTWIQTIPEGEATGVLKEVYDAWMKLAGFLPQIVKSTSLRPEFTQKFEALRLAITFGGSRLGRRKEELIALVVSVINKCHY